ncbi:hypothetical protein M422DRAFT_36992 [Sphaerobolus stellatus SS14]|uniref:Uncharacterized protein n=1 Tax=Sphaerobolus stellatus (strain SS14) TaxID=990650 RepID=A0A0C9UVL8_SPHS4|nr:hypothetical protein M422DRAFT_36992 [Sphaerobolus stellatus SS14]
MHTDTLMKWNVIKPLIDSENPLTPENYNAVLPQLQSEVREYMGMLMRDLVARVRRDFPRIIALAEQYFNTNAPLSDKDFICLPTTFFECKLCPDLMQFPSMLTHEHPLQCFAFSAKQTLFATEKIIPALGGAAVVPQNRMMLRKKLFKCLLCGEICPEGRYRALYGKNIPRRMTWRQLVKHFYIHVVLRQVPGTTPSIVILSDEISNDEASDDENSATDD